MKDEKRCLAHEKIQEHKRKWIMRGVGEREVSNNRENLYKNKIHNCGEIREDVLELQNTTFR